MRVLTLAPKENMHTYLMEGRRFVEKTEKFSSVLTSASLAVSEYMANLEGHTIYESRVGLDIEEAS